MTSLFRFAPCNECCKTGCCLHEDDFCQDDTGQAHEDGGGPGGGDPEDAEQGHLGPLWEVVSGTWFIDGGWCGNCSPTPCYYCDDENPTCYMKVVISGVTEGSCEDCSPLNNTFYLRHYSGCAWRATIDYACGVSYIGFTVGYNYLEVQAGPNRWRASISPDPTCQDFSNVSLSPYSSSSSCDNSASTCLVSAVSTNEVGYDSTCSLCENEDPPCNLRIGLYGIVALEEGNEDVTDLNGVHDLIYQGSCTWTKWFPETTATVETMTATLSGTTLTLTVADATWTADVGSTPNCVQFNLTLDPDEAGTLFDATGSIAEVSVEVEDLECNAPEEPWVGSHLGGDGTYSIIKCSEDYPGMTNSVDGNAAAQVTMTIEGVTGDGATAINDTFDLEFVKGDLWQGDVVGYVCGLGRSIDLTIEQQEDDYVWVARCGNASWTLNVGETKPSAINFTDIVLTGENSCDECDTSESTCTISGGGWGVYYLVYGWSYNSTTWRAMVDYVDADNYWCIEIKSSNYGYGAIRIIQRAEGVETIKKESDPFPVSTEDSHGTYDRHNGLWVSMRDDILSAQLSYPTNNYGYYHTTWANISAPIDGGATSRTIALGTGNYGTHGTRFKNFCMLKGSADCASWFDACAYCEDGVAPCCFEVTWSNLTATNCPLIGCLERTFNISTTRLWGYGVNPDTYNPCDNLLEDDCSIYYGCGAPQVQMDYESGDYILRARLNNNLYGSTDAIWEKNYGTTKPNCNEFNNEVLTQVETGDAGISGDCVVSAVTTNDCETDISALRIGCCCNESIPDEITVTITGVTGLGWTVEYFNNRTFAVPLVPDDCNVNYVLQLEDLPEGVIAAQLSVGVSSADGSLYGSLIWTGSLASMWLNFAGASPTPCDCSEWTGVTLDTTGLWQSGWQIVPNLYPHAQLEVNS